MQINFTHKVSLCWESNWVSPAYSPQGLPNIHSHKINHFTARSLLYYIKRCNNRILDILQKNPTHGIISILSIIHPILLLGLHFQAQKHIPQALKPPGLHSPFHPLQIFTLLFANWDLFWLNHSPKRRTLCSFYHLHNPRASPRLEHFYKPVPPLFDCIFNQNSVFFSLFPINFLFPTLLLGSAHRQASHRQASQSLPLSQGSWQASPSLANPVYDRPITAPVSNRVAMTSLPTHSCFK